MPLIGDVSPDFPPEWLIGVPMSGVAADLLKRNGGTAAEGEGNAGPGWVSLWGSALSYPPERRERGGSAKKLHYADGWYRLDLEKVTLFWHVKQAGRSDYHGHNDTGSFCLYYDGIPVIVDTGRHSFRKGLFPRYGRTAMAHNSVLIDGLEPFPVNWYGIFPPWYARKRVETSFEEKDGGFKFNIRHDGFSRISGVASFSRTFILDATGLTIEDSAEGKGEHRLYSFFHFYPRFEVIKVRPGEFSIKNVSAGDSLPPFSLRCTRREGEEVLSELYKGEPSVPAGYYFPGYGRKTETTTAVCAFRAAFPAGVSYRIDWSEEDVRH